VRFSEIARVEERWYTLHEAAVLIHRSPRTIQNLIYRHALPRRLIRQGRHPRRIIVISAATLARLRKITKT